MDIMESDKSNYNVTPCALYYTSITHIILNIGLIIIINYKNKNSKLVNCKYCKKFCILDDGFLLIIIQLCDV